jgi:hypothetical protein
MTFLGADEPEGRILRAARASLLLGTEPLDKNTGPVTYSQQ